MKKLLDVGAIIDFVSNTAQSVDETESSKLSLTNPKNPIREAFKWRLSLLEFYMSDIRGLEPRRTVKEVKRLISGSEVSSKITCIICNERLGVNKSVLRIACGHMFHEECILNYVCERYRCPHPYCEVKI